MAAMFRLGPLAYVDIRECYNAVLHFVAKLLKKKNIIIINFLFFIFGGRGVSGSR